MAKLSDAQKASSGDYVPVRKADGTIGYMKPEAIDFWASAGVPTTQVDGVYTSEASGAPAQESELSLGGDGSGFSMPNSVYNQMTGQYIPVGGTDNLNPDFGNYKQHVYLGTEHGTVWLPEGVSSQDYLADPSKYQHVDNADGFSRTVVAPGSDTPTTGLPTTGNPPPLSTGNPPPPPVSVDPPSVLPPTETPLPPNVNEPTDDWYWTDPVGYENAPPPDGTGEFVEGGPPPDTSWDWSFFRDRAPGDRQWGGFDEDYQAFERYIPGQDSPWGLPNVEGGNEDFYQQQFLNQLRDEQGYQNRERAAQMRRYEASLPENQAEPISGEEMWSWAYGGQGLPDVTMGGAPREQSWDLNSRFQQGQTNEDVLRWAADNLGGKDQRQWYLSHLNNPDADHSGTYWTSAGDPNKLIAGIPTDPQELKKLNQRYMNDLFGALYNQSAAGPSAPSNYASPVQWGSSYPGTATGGA